MLYRPSSFCLSLTIIFLALSQTYSFAQVTCIQTYLSSPDHTALGFAPSDVESVVSKVANSIGLSPSGIRVIPCDGVANAQSAYYSRDDIPKGDYILYDPVWVRQVIGNDVSGAGNSRSHDEAIFLFGHELGHLLLRHFTSSSELPRIRKEMDADHFGGCAAGALGANWETIADLISRIRGDFDTDYPSRANSLVTAKAGFDTCSRPRVPSPQTQPPPQEAKVITEKYRWCLGEYERACHPHDKYDYCGVDPRNWANTHCDSYKLVPVASYGGNKCGYAIVDLFCSNPH
jgi:hypothetical protein